MRINFKKSWFLDRYLHGSIINNNLPFIGNRVVVLSGYDKSLKEAFNEFSKLENSQMYYSQNNCMSKYLLEIYLNITDNIDYDDFILKIPSKLTPKLVNIVIENNYVGTYSQLEGLYGFLYSSSNDPAMLNFLENEESKKTVENITCVLRDQFFFCTTCANQYDNKAEMLIKCSSHAKNDTLIRALELFGHDYGFNDAEKYVRGFDLLNDFFDVSEIYKCKVCEETFSDYKLGCQHYLQKHYNGEEEKKFMVLFECLLLSKIDILALDFIFGTVSKQVPWYSLGSDVDEVIYDLPHVYSGNINLE